MADDSTARDAKAHPGGEQPGDETTMDDILRSIRSILKEDGAPEGRDGFELNAVASNANDANASKPAPVGPGGPLAFIQKRKPQATPPGDEPACEPPAEAAEAADQGAARAKAEKATEQAPRPVDVPAADETRKITLEDRLAAHRRKADAERIALRRLTARALGAGVREVGSPAREEVKEASVDPLLETLVESFEEAFAASDDLFEPSALPDVPTEDVDYSARASQVDRTAPADGMSQSEPLGPLPADRAPVPVPDVNDIARAMLEQQGDAIHDAMRDMLRPMVRDWLDDNMSSIVEKVVREEIERVSRARR